MEITYSRQGDYYLPDLRLPELSRREIGIWGAMRRRYLKENHKILYYNLLTKCRLGEHLADINEDAVEMYERLVKQFSEKEGVTAQLREENQMEWVRRMNHITSRAREIVCKELIIW